MTCTDGRCIPACEEDSDCLGDFRCVAGACLDTTGTCPANLGLEEVSGFCTASCSPGPDASCPGNTICAAGFCAPGCTDDWQCPQDYTCKSSVCLPACDIGHEDSADDINCPADMDLACIDDSCIPTCKGDDDCPFGTCYEGFCNASMTLFRIEKGHAQIAGSPLYDTVLGLPQSVGGEPIRGLTAGSGNDVCTGNADVVLTLSDLSGAHVSGSGFNYAVCLHSDIKKPSVRCRIQKGSCSNNEISIARVSDYHDSHVLPPFATKNEMNGYMDSTYFGVTINEVIKDAVIREVFGDWLHVCCSVPTDSDGDGFAPAPGGDDCNDTNDFSLCSASPASPEECDVSTAACAICRNPEATEFSNTPGSEIDENCNAIKEESVNSDDDTLFDGYWDVDGNYIRIDQCPDQFPPDSDNSDGLPKEILDSYSFLYNKSGCILQVHDDINNPDYKGNLDGWSADNGARAFVVRDPTAIANRESSKTLMVYGDADGYIAYDVLLEPQTQYTISFRYKKEQGAAMSFRVDGSELVPTNTLDKNTWTSFHATFRTGDDEVTAQLIFTLGDNTIFFLDNLQLEIAPEPTIFNLFETADVGCCPYDFCWTGGLIPDHPSCIHDDYYEKNVSMPPIGWEEFSTEKKFLESPNGYRCIDGKWKFSRPKFTPLYDAAGYCPDDNQCFIGGGDTVDKACVASDTFNFTQGESGEIETFYCYKGNWTTRTKEIALQMMNMANQSTDNTYTIFCDRFDRSLNADQFMNYYRDYLGENIVQAMTSGNINEFCVMELNSQVIAGVSLNMEINESSGGGDCVPGGIKCIDEGNCDDKGCLIGVTGGGETKSFLQMLKGDEQNHYCDHAIVDDNDNPIDDGLYHECDGTDVYYNAKLNNVLFTKMHDMPFDTRQQVPLNAFESKTFIDVIFDIVKRVFDSLLSITGLARPQTALVQQDQLDFIEKAGSFDKLYISYSPPAGLFGKPRYIKAIRETRYSSDKHDFVTFLSAEYHNYQADICNFFYKHNYNDLRRQISEDGRNIQCTPVILNDDQHDNEWMHSIYVEDPVLDRVPDDLRDVRVWKMGADNFWNDLTAKIRTQPSRPLTVSNLDAPDFTISPTDPDTGAPNPVVGTPMEFNIVIDPGENSHLIARTWDFGDGKKASSSYNITTKHMYEAEGNYNVTLWVMDSNYNIASRTFKDLHVAVGPSVVIERIDDDAADSTVDMEFLISGGHKDFNIMVDWGDGTSNQGSSDADADADMDPDDVFKFADITDGDGEVTGGRFSATHVYEFEDSIVKPTIKVTVIDAYGVTFRSENVILVRGP